MKTKLLLFTMIFSLCTSCTLNEVANLPGVKVDFSKDPREMKPFWNATGFSPAELLLKPDMQQVVKEVGELPDAGINYVRPHYMLNLVAASGFETGNPVYDWSMLDEAIDHIVENDLKFIFELMGTPAKKVEHIGGGFDDRYQEQLEKPSSYFDNLTQDEQIRNWKRFITDLALHLEERYGEEEVRSWYFETTNEPDIKHFWKFGVQAFLNYYDACSEGLLAADDQLVFGGPGNAKGLSEYFKALLEHCDSGTNYITGETGVRLDFISVHVKDTPFEMVDRTMNAVDYIRENHPKFKDLPFINDEADPMVGWSKEYWWRRGAWYAAFVCQSADVNYRKLIDSAGVNLVMISNDHTFMGNWENRTTHARFVKEDEYRLVRKPVLTVMHLMAKLGTQRFDAVYNDSVDRYFGIIPTQTDNGYAILLYNKTDVRVNIKEREKYEPTFEKEVMEREHLNIAMKLQNLSHSKYKITHYRIDENHANPYQKWVDMGMPEWPSEEQIALLNEAAMPEIIDEREVDLRANNLLLPIDLPSSSVSLVLLEQ